MVPQPQPERSVDASATPPPSGEAGASAPAALSRASGIKSFISGGVGGICLVAAGHPLDLIKVRLQTQAAGVGQYKGMLDCARQTVAREGVRGLYRGMLTPLAGVTPVFSVCFWGYDMGKRLARFLKFSVDSTEQSVVEQPLSLTQIGFAGAFSAVPTTLLMTPMERVKCLLQVQGEVGARVLRGPVDAVRTIVREGGLRGLYTGCTATLLRDGIGSIGYFVAYEAIGRTLTRAGEPSPGAGAVLLAGGAAGMANWAVAIPLDVLKSRQQTAAPGTYSGLRDVLMKTVKQEGPGALLKGLGPAMARAFPANAACFMGVEASRRTMDKVW